MINSIGNLKRTLKLSKNNLSSLARALKDQSENEGMGKAIISDFSNYRTSLKSSLERIPEMVNLTLIPFDFSNLFQIRISSFSNSSHRWTLGHGLNNVEELDESSHILDCSNIKKELLEVTDAFPETAKKSSDLRVLDLSNSDLLKDLSPKKQMRGIPSGDKFGDREVSSFLAKQTRKKMSNDRTSSMPKFGKVKTRIKADKLSNNSGFSSPYSYSSKILFGSGSRGNSITSKMKGKNLSIPDLTTPSWIKKSSSTKDTSKSGRMNSSNISVKNTSTSLYGLGKGGFASVNKLSKKATLLAGSEPSRETIPVRFHQQLFLFLDGKIKHLELTDSCKIIS